MIGSRHASKRREELSRRLEILLDVVVAEGGEPYKFADIQEALTAKGISLSRARWFYMREGTGATVTDRKLLSALADFFGVPAGYLLDSDPELPARVEAQLKLLKAMRIAEVQSFAARALGDLSPAATEAIAKILEEEMKSTD
ncbi:hypothetical protein [Pseudarthrobacter sp. 1C304]|uniref:hypothetical protein n=1 Tax=Pseudarthrobacter sp. 1C304 TaxID=3457438 RepID=UPI003FD54545